MSARLPHTQEKLSIEERERDGTKVADGGSFIKRIVFLFHLISL